MLPKQEAGARWDSSEKARVSRSAVAAVCSRGALSAPCKVLDVSETGVRIESRLFVKSGDALQLVIELEQGRTLTCGLQVVHVRSPKFGATISVDQSGGSERLAHILRRSRTEQLLPSVALSRHIA